MVGEGLNDHRELYRGSETGGKRGWSAKLLIRLRWRDGINPCTNSSLFNIWTERLCHILTNGFGPTTCSDAGAAAHPAVD